MGKSKIFAKYRLIGRNTTLFFAFSAVVLSFVIFGDISYFVFGIFDRLNIVFSSFFAESAVRISVCTAGIILFLLIVSPLWLGCERWFILCAEGKRAKFRELFYYFSAAGISKSVCAVIYSTARKVSALILFLFPSACLFGVLYFSFIEGEISLYISYALFGFAVTLFLTGLCFFYIYTARYFAFYSIIITEPEIKVHNAFEKSVRLTEGAYGKISIFKLSFLPWFLLCALILPSFYVWGYYKESKAVLNLKGSFSAKK